MSTVGWATLDVIPSVKGLRAELEKQTGGDLSRAGALGGKKYGDAAGKEAAGRFKGHLATATDDLKRMLASPLAVGAIGTGIVLGFKNVKTAASEAEQAVGGVQAVFKDYANGVLADSKRADQALGLSATAYQELITLSAALLKNKGIEDFAEQGKTLIEVGADLAAQFGGSTREAVEALNAAMRGESDPIERYAISLNEAAINAELARTGMSGLEGAALDQAKTQARLSLIMQQSADAQGAFGREADTAAGKEARLSAELANMRQELGEKVLPAYASFIGFLNDEGIPALASAGGVAQDVGSAISELPTPVKAAATAFVALRLASATGLTGGIVTTAGTARDAIDSLRIRTMLAADAYTNARTVTREFAGTTARVSSTTGRAAASLQALRAGATGAGSALRSGLGGAVGMLGGPWGIALIAGTTLLTKFWSEHQEAKAHVDSLTQSLDEQTGAITENTEAEVVNALEKEGMLKKAQELGLGLELVTRAAMGEADALSALRAERDRQVAALDGQDRQQSKLIYSYDALLGAIGGQNSAIDAAQSKQRRLAEASGDAAGATDDSTDATKRAAGELRTYASEIDDARSKLQKLIDKEKERALNAIQSRRDHIALLETVKAAREEAGKGTRTLNTNTEAGQANMTALLDLAEQWSTSTPKVQNARGAYEKMRQEFIELATSMGGGGESAAAQAKKLADELLKIPKKAPLRFQTEGYQEAMEEMRRLREAAHNLTPLLSVTPFGFQAPDGRPAPRLPQDRTTTPSPTASKPPMQPRANVLIENQTVVAPDPAAFKREMQRQNQMAGIGGVG